MKRVFGVVVVYLMMSPVLLLYLAWLAMQGVADGLEWCFKGRWLFRRWIAVCERAAIRLDVGDIL